MKRGNTDPRKREKRGAALGLALFAVLQAVCAAAFWALTLIPDCPRWLVIGGVLSGAAGSRPVGLEKKISGAGRRMRRKF